MNLLVTSRLQTGPTPVEIVERKGLGHPDTICDALAEQLSVELSKLYLERFDTVLHHNVDKALLWGGASAPRFGGGEILAPIEIFLAGRAVRELRGVRLPIDEIVVETARAWLRDHLPTIDLERGVVVHPLVRPGSSELVKLFGEGSDAVPLANDTSCGVGWAPRSTLEQTVLDVEHELNSARLQAAHPWIGADIKIMAVRDREAIALTVACAFVDHHVADLTDYAAKREQLRTLVQDRVGPRLNGDLVVAVNTGDDLERGQIYLTVTGTSAEAGDDGEAGRGNRVGGLITPHRPMTMESCAGKNPITHIGKLYNLLAPEIANAAVASVPGIAAARCYLVSRIGHPISDPQLVHVDVDLDSGAERSALEPALLAIVDEHLARLPTLWREVLASSFVVA